MMVANDDAISVRRYIFQAAPDTGDGNSAIITSTIPYVKRLMKQLEAYSK